MGEERRKATTGGSAGAKASSRSVAYDRSTLSDRIRMAALDAGTFDTVLGEIAFDDAGDPLTTRYVWYVWEDGTYREM